MSKQEPRRARIGRMVVVSDPDARMLGYTYVDTDGVRVVGVIDAGGVRRLDPRTDRPTAR